MTPGGAVGLNRRALLTGAPAAAGLAAAGLAVRPAAAGPGDDPRMGRIAAQAGLLFGFALDARQLAVDAPYRAFVSRQASIVVPENALKWQAVHPAPSRFRFADADEIADFARDNRIRMRGHTLCWHRALPDWVEQTVTPTNAASVLEEHIRVVAGRYKGRMQSWDVVNEAIAPENNLPGGWRDGFWHRMLGPSFLDIAFHAARAADPDAVLCYNEYGLESDGDRGRRKRDAVLGMLRDARQRGVPIGALGVQSHLRAGDGSSFGPGLAGFLRQVRALGLQIYVTELDVDDSGLAPDRADDAVADVYARYLDLVLGTGAVSAVLCWGVWDWPHPVGATPPGLIARRPMMFGPGGATTAATRAVARCFERVAPLR